MEDEVEVHFVSDGVGRFSEAQCVIAARAGVLWWNTVRASSALHWNYLYENAQRKHPAVSLTIVQVSSC